MTLNVKTKRLSLWLQNKSCPNQKYLLSYRNKLICVLVDWQTQMFVGWLAHIIWIARIKCLCFLWLMVSILPLTYGVYASSDLWCLCILWLMVSMLLLTYGIYDSSDLWCICLLPLGDCKVALLAPGPGGVFPDTASFNSRKLPLSSIILLAQVEWFCEIFTRPLGQGRVMVLMCLSVCLSVSVCVCPPPLGCRRFDPQSHLRWRIVRIFNRPQNLSAS